MVLSADSTKLEFCEKAADDESASPELRLSFARKANWHRISARLQARHPQTDGHPSELRADPEALLFSPTRLSAGRIRQWRIANTPRRAGVVTGSSGDKY